MFLFILRKTLVFLSHFFHVRSKDNRKTRLSDAYEFCFLLFWVLYENVRATYCITDTHVAAPPLLLRHHHVYPGCCRVKSSRVTTHLFSTAAPCRCLSVLGVLVPCLQLPSVTGLRSHRPIRIPIWFASIKLDSDAVCVFWLSLGTLE